MAFPAVDSGAPYIQSAQFVAAYIRASGEKWQTLGDIGQATLTVRVFTSPDGYGLERSSQVFDVSASCRMRQTAFEELDLMRSICNGQNDFLFRLADAAEVVGIASGGWVYVAASQVGCKSTFRNMGDTTYGRYTLLEWQGSIYASAANTAALFTPTLTDSDFESSADSGTYHSIGRYTADEDGGLPNEEHLQSAGLVSVMLDVAGGSDPVTIGPVKDADITVEMLATEDSLRRYLPNALAFDVGYDWWASDKADIVALREMLPLAVDAVLTMPDGVAIRLSNQVGIQADYDISDGLEHSKIIRLAHRGKSERSTLEIDYPWDWSSTNVYFTNTMLRFSRGA